MDVPASPKAAIKVLGFFSKFYAELKSFCNVVQM